jgi:MFS family permease
MPPRFERSTWGAETTSEVVGAMPLGERAVPEPGLRQNWRQFSLLVLVNAFVGGMVGIERAILPLVASQDFGLASSAAMLSFITSFGIVKAATNLFTGYLADHVGRKRLLVLGWVIGLPVPLLLMWAPTWTWIIAANALLGLNQGLCWSTTVIMKIDLVGSKRRGLAMGLNEFAGYGAVAAATVASAYLADLYGLRPWPFLLGVVFAAAGLLLSWSLVRDTAQFVEVESRRHPPAGSPPLLRPSFLAATAGSRQLFACNQAGLVNNLNDGVAWGLFPLLFAGAGLDLRQVGMLAALYTLVWCISQVATGALSDRWGRKWLIVGGMCLQGVALWTIAWPTPSSSAYTLWLGGVVLLGLGTAFVYPTLLAAIGDVVHPAQRGSAVGVYRFWRDLGYAVGALVAGLTVDRIGMRGTIAVVAALTFASGLVVASRMSRSPLVTDTHHGIET